MKKPGVKHRLAFATIRNEQGVSLRVSLQQSGSVERGWITIDGLPCHIERMSRKRLSSKYHIDEDPNYRPVSDLRGRCVIVVPYSE